MVTYTFGHYTQQISVQLRREGYPALLAGSRLQTAAPNEVVQAVADQIIEERVNRGVPGLEEWVEELVGYSSPWQAPVSGGRMPVAVGCP